jgi:ferredoxin
MTYVVLENCIRCKFTDCVDVCPVEAFHEGENMLVINPEACIDCGVCEPECPADAIVPDSMADDKWLALNVKLSSKWPLITRKIDAPEDANDFTMATEKFDKYFSEKPAEAR